MTYEALLAKLYEEEDEQEEKQKSSHRLGGIYLSKDTIRNLNKILFNLQFRFLFNLLI